MHSKSSHQSFQKRSANLRNKSSHSWTKSINPTSFYRIPLTYKTKFLHWQNNTKQFYTHYNLKSKIIFDPLRFQDKSLLFWSTVETLFKEISYLTFLATYSYWFHFLQPFEVWLNELYILYHNMKLCHKIV